MFTQEKKYSYWTFAALAAAVLVAFVVLIHSFSELKFSW
jgi:hypothetical protein